MKKINIYIAGHNGMVGRSIHKYLQKKKIGNIITADRKKLNLENLSKVNKFIIKRLVIHLNPHHKAHLHLIVFPISELEIQVIPRHLMV